MWKLPDRKESLPIGANLQMMVNFSLETTGDQEKNVVKHFSCTERKQLSTQSPITRKNNLQRWKRNQDILRWRKTMGVYPQQTYPERMAKQNPLNRKEKMKKGNQEGRENRWVKKE